ncbi:MAG: hypothetical protein EXR85_07685 [Xanthomonadales bacterium]|nr:hypothetical protein [Xanthomonadales bacterium]
METFLALNEVLVELSVLIAAISNYLIINKLWSRRTRKDVAESISISALGDCDHQENRVSVRLNPWGKDFATK